MTTQADPGVLAGHKINTLVGYAFGAIFILVGLAGFLVSGGHHAVGQSGGHLLGLFQVNVLHNVAHLALGAILITAATAGNAVAKRANSVVGAVYLVLFVAGLFIIGTGLNIVALNAADNLLHLALGAALVGIGLAADRPGAPTS